MVIWHRSPRSRVIVLGVLVALGMVPVWAGPQDVKPAAAKPQTASSAAEPYLFQLSNAVLPTTLPRWWATTIAPDGKTMAIAAGNTSERGEIWLFDFPSGKFRALIPHKAGIRQVAFAPDSQSFAAVGFDNTVYLYDARLLRVLATGIGHTAGINSVAFTNDGKRLITGGLDNTVRVWRVPSVTVTAEKQTPPTFAPYAILQGHTNFVLSVAVSKDGKTIVSGGRDNVARLWDMPEPALPGQSLWKVHEIAKILDAALNGPPPLVVTTPRKVLSGHTNAVEAVAIANDGRIVATGSWDMTAKTWLVATGEVLKTFTGHKAGVWSVALSPDGTILATAAGTTAATPPQPPPAQMAQPIPVSMASPEPALAPAPLPVSEVRTWNLADAKLRAEHPRHERGVSCVTFSNDGKRLISIGEEGSARIMSIAAAAELVNLKRAVNAPSQIMLAVAVSRNGKLLAAGGDGKHIALWDLEKREFRGAWQAHDDVVSALAFSPDSSTLVSGSYDRQLKFWNVANWRPGEFMPPVRKVSGHTNWIFAVAFSADGKYLASGGYDKLIRLWDLANWTENWFTTAPPVKLLKGHTAGVRALAFTPDQQRLASVSADRSLRLWHLPDGAQIGIARGHKGALRAVAVSHDGRTFATGSEDKDVKLWQFSALKDNTLEAKETASFGDLGDMVGVMAFSPRGLTLSVGLWNGQVHLLDPALGKRRTLLAGHNDSVSALAFAPDGKLLITGSYDRQLRLWEPPPPLPPPLLAYPGHQDAVNAIALSADGKWTVTGSRDGSLRFFDRARGRMLLQVQGHAGGVHHVVFSRDSQYLASGGADKIVRLWSATGVKLAEFAGHTDEVLQVAFAPNGHYLASAGKDRHIRIWRTHGQPGTVTVPWFRVKMDSRLVATLTGHTGPVTALAFSPDAKKLASAGADRNFRLWDVAGWQLTAEIPGSATNGEFAALAFSPDGKTIALAHNQDQLIGPCGDLLQQQFRNVMLVDAATGKATEQGNVGFLHPDWVTGLAWSSDGETLVTSARDMNVRLWNVAGKRIIRQFKAHEASIAAMALDPDEELVATAGDDRAARLWNVSMQQVIARASLAGHAGQIWFAELSHDGKYLVTGGDDKIVRLRSALPGAEPYRITGAFPAVYSVAASPDEKLLASGHADGTIRILDAATGKQLALITADKYRVWGLAFTPDSKRLVSVTGDWDNQSLPGTVKLWDAAGGKLIRTFQGALGTIFALALAPDGKTLAAGGQDQQVRLWDIDTGQLQQTLKGYPGPVRTVTFSIDGLTLVAGSHRASTLLFWDTTSGAEKARLALPDEMFVNRVHYMPNGKRLVLAGNVKPQFVKFSDPTQQSAFRPQSQEVGRITLWDLEKNEAVYHQHGHLGMALDLSIHPRGDVLCSVGGAPNGAAEVHFWNAERGFRMGMFHGHARWCEAGIFLPDGRLFTGSGNAQNPGELKVWNTDGIAVTKGFDAHAKYVSSASFHPHNTWLATGSGDHSVILWDFAKYLKTGIVAKRVLTGHNEQVRVVRFSPDGSILASAAENGTVIFWDPKTGAKIRTLQAATDRGVYGIAFSPDGKRLVTGAGNWRTRATGECKLWDVASGKQLGELPGHSLAVWAVTFSPDGKWIVTGAGDQNIRAFDAQTLALKHTLLAAGGLRDIRFAPDGKTFASCAGVDNDTAIRLWDAENWREKTTLTGHTGLIFTVRYTPDGKTLLSASKDAKVKLWDLPQKKPVATAMGK